MTAVFSALNKTPKRLAVSKLQRLDIRSLQAFLTLLDFEFNTLVFNQGLKAVSFDVTEVSEEVSATRILSNEAVAFAVVEPLHGTGLSRHGRIS
jgi:hypothetical protein